MNALINGAWQPHVYLFSKKKIIITLLSFILDCNVRISIDEGYQTMIRYQIHNSEVDDATHA